MCLFTCASLSCAYLFFFNDTATTEIYTLSLHDALPISVVAVSLVTAPATAQVLRGKPVFARGPAVERTPPTGAVVVAALAKEFGAMPPMRIAAIGYGAGDRDFKEH